MINDHFFVDSSLLFKALSHPLRLRMINFISFAPRTVEECSEKFGQSIQNVSQHLQQLNKLDVFDVLKIKNYHYYTLKNELIPGMISTVARISDNYSVDQSERWSGSILEASKVIRSGKRYILDLRTDEEKSHLTIPSKYLLQDPQHSCFVVCRGPWCEKLSKEVQKLKGQKLDVLSLSYTFDELKLLINYLE